MSKAFYLRLAVQNIKRGRAVFLPQMIATAVMSGVYFLINGLLHSEGLSNTPSGPTAQTIFAMGIMLFSLFSFFFMFYINSFLIKRRKREFGLYAVLGMNKRQIAFVLILENLLTMGVGLIIGILFALAIGNLLFLLLLQLIRSAGDATFSIGWSAYVITFALFGVIFLANTIYNVISVRLSNPIALLQTEKKGDKSGKGIFIIAAIGAILLIIAYYFAWTIDMGVIALGIFFPLALLVIIATYLLFQSGSVALLKALRANKSFYYRTRHFATIGGLIHRMRQNAQGLATICILSTMLLVTVSGTLALYLGSEQMLKETFPFDVRVYAQNINSMDQMLASIHEHEKENDVKIVNAADKLIFLTEEKTDGLFISEREIKPNQKAEMRGDIICVISGERVEYLFDLEGEEENKLAFCKSFSEPVSDVFRGRLDNYAMYGGLLFLGAFFGLLFLAITVLIIYFKQISEGYEDKQRFEIMQKVGMDQREVKKTINSQVLFVFFVPLVMSLIHMLFASRIMTEMLQVFRLSDWPLVLACIGGVCVVFVLIYLLVYKMTAKTYFKIVKRG